MPENTVVCKTPILTRTTLKVDFRNCLKFAQIPKVHNEPVLLAQTGNHAQLARFLRADVIKTRVDGRIGGRIYLTQSKLESKRAETRLATQGAVNIFRLVAACQASDGTTHHTRLTLCIEAVRERRQAP